MATIYATRRIPEQGLRLLENTHEVDIYEGDAPPQKKEIIQGVKNTQGLLCLLTDPIDKEVLSSAPHLKVISAYSVGYDNIDIQEATQRNVIVAHTPGVLTETAADFTWALILSTARRIVNGDHMMRTGQFKGWGPMVLLGTDVYKKTLGIIGAGRIGQAVARRAQGFNMDILYHSRKRNRDFEKECNAQFVDMKTLLTHSDFISLHIPLTNETHHLIGEKELKLMKKTSYLINTSRGKCVDEEALTRALKTKEIMGAALDVYEHEPSISPHLAELDNVILAPHAASASIQTRTRMAVITAENMLAGLEGRMPKYCVNPEVFSH